MTRPDARLEILRHVVQTSGGRVQYREIDARGSRRSDGLFTCPPGSDPEKYIPDGVTHVRSGPKRPWIRLPGRSEEART